jgi:hypothetical protein
MFGWRGRLLRVNLSNSAVTKELLVPETARDYLGGRGLGFYLHEKEVPASIEPLSAGNHLIFTTGPLTGTLAPNGGRYTVVTRTASSEALCAVSISGKWGSELKFAGFDGIIFEGCSDEPVYLWIDNGKTELRSAAHLTGKTVSETTDTLIRETHNGAVVSCIGPAGEKGVDCSVIVGDSFSAAGKNGVAAVMGSKNLKAVVVNGTEGFRLADYQRFLKAANELRSFMKTRAIAVKGVREHESVLMADSISWDANNVDLKPARTRGCFGCATSFSSFVSNDGTGLLPLLAGNTPAELGESLREYRSLVDLGLDYAAAKSILSGANGKTLDLAHNLASGAKVEAPVKANGNGNGSSPFIERGPCMAAGFAIFPRIPAADGRDENCSDLLAILDSVGLCPFLGAGIEYGVIAELLTSATGIEFSQQDILQVAQRIRPLGR